MGDVRDRLFAFQGRVVCFPPKVAPPKVRPGTVSRDRVVDQLVATDATEITINAPAGYGKSTVATIWAERDERPFGWVAVDDADNDPVVFLTYLVLALDAVGPVDDRLVEDLTTAPVPWPEVLAHLLDTVTAIPAPFVLIIDDAHRLTGPSATHVLPAVASRVPPRSALVTIGRGRTPYPSSRGLVAGRVLGVGVNDLAMDASEAAALLLAAGIEPDRWESDALHEKVEGWPAGLYMAALALRNADVPGQRVRHFAGGDHLVTEYFTEEILRAMSADDVDFLLSTAVLTRLSAALCDDVLGIIGSGATLERLASDNQFVIPLDHDGEWYRYHHLFQEMLLTEMRARRPDVVREVAGRASAWFDERAEPEAAIEHALAVHDERAVEMIFRYSPTMLATNRVDTVGHWLAQYTEQDIERVPALALTAAWQRLAVGDMGAVHRLTSALEAKLDDRLPNGAPVSSMVAILHALTRTDGLSAMRENAARAYAELPPDSPYRIIACFLEGSAATYLGDLVGAGARLREGIRLGRAVLPAVYAQCLAGLARVELALDHQRDADLLVDEAVRVLDAHQVRDRPPACVCLAIASVVHLQRGETALGNEERELGASLLERAEDLSPYQLLGSRLELALAAVLANDLDGARNFLDDAERRLAWMPETGSLGATADAIRSMLTPAPSPGAQLIEPLTPAELRVLAYLPTHLSFSEIGASLYVSRNTVKSHAMAIYRKLGVTSRSEAVLEAQQCGLVADDPTRTRP